MRILLIILLSFSLCACHHRSPHRFAVKQQLEQVDSAHAYLRSHMHLPDTPDINQLAEELEDGGYHCEAGKAYYIAGAGKNIVGEDAEAMQDLKRAEMLLTDQAEPFYPGMVYYKMGRISENEMLYEVALHYYRKALPYLEKNGQPLYLASVCREIARMTIDTVEQRDYFQKALSYAASLDTITQLDIQYAYLSYTAPQSPLRLEISRYLCDSAKQLRYAQDIVREHIRTGNYDKAQQYLHLLQNDSSSILWSREKQAYLHSILLHHTGKNEQAFEEMKSLYDSISYLQETSGHVRSFAIAQRFDNAAEREKNLQLQLQQQRLYNTIFAIVAIMLLASAIAIFFALRAKSKRLIQQTKDQAEIDRLRNELKLRQQSLQRTLQQRLQLNKSLQEHNVSHQEDAPLPPWAKEFVEANIFQTTEQWDVFRTEFDQAYEGLLDRLKQEHPDITAADQQIISLIVLQLDISDICLLLNLSKRTIWSRRLRIKTHLGLAETDQLDSWLFSQINRN